MAATRRLKSTMSACRDARSAWTQSAMAATSQRCALVRATAWKRFSTAMRSRTAARVRPLRLGGRPLPARRTMNPSHVPLPLDELQKWHDGTKFHSSLQYPVGMPSVPTTGWKWSMPSRDRLPQYTQQSVPSGASSRARSRFAAGDSSATGGMRRVHVLRHAG